ncbi:hypothetical protein [Desulfosediminicola flagellatus]|uniref:hypothetical protein n=1 Tax=Desulfosediminicola flagellatus TaxID=2569541 RepID=UPI0010AD9C65|nr:hypothetical protein [Desulfosediminicola flagellatus]
MNNITSQFPLAGFSSRQAPLSDFRSAGYAKEQSYRSQESLNTGLVIQTKDGDQVTLTSNSFTEMDAYMYDSKGVVQTDSGSAAFSHNVREVTLASGQSFSFTVEGDLSEDELEDIDSIIQGLDGVISEMKDGDMSGALDKALNIGSFDTVSSYAADISYQRSYEMSSAVAATATQFQPAAEEAPEEQRLAAPVAESSPELSPFNGKKRGLMDFDTFFKKMIKQFEAHEDKQIGLAKDPINTLFKHHLDEIGKDDDSSGSIYSALETAMNDIDSLIQEKMNTLFNDQLAEFAEPAVSTAPAETAEEDN